MEDNKGLIPSSGFRVPAWFKVTFGVAVIGAAIWKLPMWDILASFLMVVLIPLGLLASVGLVSQGTIELFQTGANQGAQAFWTKFKEHRSNFASEPIVNVEVSTVGPATSEQPKPKIVVTRGNGRAKDATEPPPYEHIEATA